MALTAQANRKEREKQVISVQPDKMSIRIRKSVFRGLEKTEKLRDAVGEFIGKFLAVGWPGFAAAFLYCTMVPAVAGMMTVGGIAFLVGSLVTATLGLIANIGLLKYNQHKLDIKSALDKAPLSEEKQAEQAKSKYKKNAKEQGLTYGVQQMMDRMQAMITKMKDKEAIITRKTAHEGITIAAAADPTQFRNETTNKILTAIDKNGYKTKIRPQNIEAKIAQIKQQNQALTHHIQGKDGKGGLLAKEAKMAKSRGARFLAYAFQTFAETCGMAGLPFFVFLSTNALVITFLTNPIAISVVVGLSVLWGLVCGVAFIRDKYKEFKEHEANVDQLSEAVSQLEEKQTEMAQTWERLFEFADVTKDFAGITIDNTPAKTTLETAYGSPLAGSNRAEDIFSSGGKRPQPKPMQVAVGEDLPPAVAVAGFGK